MATNTGSIVTNFAELWPREVFDLREGKNRVLESEFYDQLNYPGVYILYRDDVPYYIGKTEKSLYNRVYQHANKPDAKYYRYWNYFSVYVVEDVELIDDVEGILITAIPAAANSSKPRIPKIPIPRRIKYLIGRLRVKLVDSL